MSAVSNSVAPGHVFLLHGDVTNIACDVWLLPTNRNFKVEDFWKFDGNRKPEPPPGWGKGGVRVAKAKPIEGETGNRPYLVDVGGDVAGRNDISWYLEGARQFLQCFRDQLANLKSELEECGKQITRLNSEPESAETKATIASLQQREAKIKDEVRPCYRRGSHLLLMPVIGTGKGGAGTKVGEMLEQLLRLLMEHAFQGGFDIALVVKGEVMYSAAQRARSKIGPDAWSAFGGSEHERKALLKKADFLADKAMRGELALFIGAGVSFGAGLPLWGDLIKALSDEAGMSASEQNALKSMDFLDAARVIQNRLRDKSLAQLRKLFAKRKRLEKQLRNVRFKGGVSKSKAGKESEQLEEEMDPDDQDWLTAEELQANAADAKTPPSERLLIQNLQELDLELKRAQENDNVSLGLLVAQRMLASTKHYAMQHALLSALPCTEVITTNYDQLYEIARQATGKPVSVIPHKPLASERAADSARGWLLKLHGCVTRPEEIVLSRDDYMAYDSSRSALAGIVQAMLLTKHMLFVGFSLTDYNFHKIISAVRMAMENYREAGASSVAAAKREQEMRKSDSILSSEEKADGSRRPSVQRQLYQQKGYSVDSRHADDDEDDESASFDDASTSGSGSGGSGRNTPQSVGARAAKKAKSRRYGTALWLVREELQEELWTTDLHMISMTKRPADSQAPLWTFFPEAARQLEMFLDYVGSKTCSSSMFLLNPSYEHMLSKEDKAFASWLQSFFEKAPEQARQANAWAHLERFQRTLGGGLDQAGLALTARSASAPVLPGVSNGAATPYVRTPYVKGGARAPKDASQQQPEQQQTSKDDLLVRSRSDVLKPSDAGLSTPTVDQSVIASSGVQAVNGTAPATPIKHGPVSAVNVDGKLLPVISPSRFAQSSASQLAAAASDELPPASRLNLPATQMNRDVSVSCGSNLIPRNDSVMVPPASTDPGTGHVFISRSDIRMLACDAWLSPNTRSFYAKNAWVYPTRLTKQISEQGVKCPRVSDDEAFLTIALPPSFPREQRVAKLPKYPANRSPPYLTSVVGRDINYVLDCVQQCLAIMAQDLKDTLPRHGRSKHLVAVPVVGTGGGGLRHETGAVLHRLLRLLYVGVAKYCFDIVLVCWDEPTYSAAQLARFQLIDPTRQEPDVPPGPIWSKTDLKKREKEAKAAKEAKEATNSKSASGKWSAGSGSASGQSPPSPGMMRKISKAAMMAASNLFPGYFPTPPSSEQPLRPLPRSIQDLWSCLRPEQLQQVIRLSQTASEEELVLFFSSQVGLLPSQSELLRRIAEETRCVTPSELEQMAGLGAQDQARFLSNKLGADVLVQHVAKQLSPDEVTLFHALLAKLPCAEVITTSQDALFERCAKIVDGAKITVLPLHFGQGTDTMNAKRWLLKLNGCISRPSDVVLTREDFVSSEHQRSVLATIVQALLITKHMVFVGASLRDENFHRALDAVTKVMKSSQRRDHEEQPICTVVTPSFNQLLQEMWQPQISMVMLSDRYPSESARAIRRMEVFLDCMLAHISISPTSTQRHLLDDRFSLSLTQSEKVLRDYIDQQLQQLPAEALESNSFPMLEQLLDRLGADQFNYHLRRWRWGKSRPLSDMWKH